MSPVVGRKPVVFDSSWTMSMSLSRTRAEPPLIHIPGLGRLVRLEIKHSGENRAA
jgi:hypothetical protein